MKSNNDKGFVSSYIMVQFFLKKLFEQNLIDTDTYVFAMNMAKEECDKADRKVH
ncbi:MAG: hypothetical protein IJD40_10880 [Lachnospiraceae bacterium]|nr:hypothetical protein [Lachnospiraceae bacterium]